MPARRNVWLAFMLLVLAFVPTVSSFYRGLPEMSEQVSKLVPEKLVGMTGTPTPRKTAEIRNGFGTRDWMERVYRARKGVPITLFIARGYDCRPFFHMPEYALLDRAWSKRKHTVDHWMLDEGRTDTIHVLELTGLKVDRKVYYALLYKDKTIGNPYWFLIRNLPEMLLAKRKPYTLIFLSFPIDTNENAADEGARKLLASSLRQMLRRQSETPDLFQLPEPAHRAAAQD